MRRPLWIVSAMALALAACERQGGGPAAPSAPAPPSAEKTAPARPAAPSAIPALPSVIREKLEPLPLDAPVERGAKPTASAELAKEGLALFEKQCATCHGAKGAGDGPAAWAAEPRPRNFTKGIFKLHTNDNGSLPTDEDLFDTITRGMPGSAMPSFAALSTDDRWALVAAVKEQTVFVDPDEEVEIHFFKDRPPTPPLPLGTPVESATPEVLAKGKGAYLKLECNKCHGLAGEADGPSAKDLKDDWGEPMWPRNFQEARPRGVRSIRNYVERINTGLSGTPMAAFGSGQLTDEEKWSIAHYLASMRRGWPAPQPPPSGVLVAARRADPIPVDQRQPRFWLDVPCYEVALEGDGPRAARIQVQRDATNLAIAISWDDPIATAHPPSAEDFLDALTVELGAGGKENVLQWRGEWQRDGKPPAQERAGGTQKLSATAKWSDGQWRILLVRPLAGGGERIPLEGAITEVSLSIEDRSPAGTRVSTARGLKLGVP